MKWLKNSNENSIKNNKIYKKYIQILLYVNKNKRSKVTLIIILNLNIFKTFFNFNMALRCGQYFY